MCATKSRAVENCRSDGVDLVSTVMALTAFSSEKTEEEVGEPPATLEFSAVPKTHFAMAKDGKAFARVFSPIF